MKDVPQAHVEWMRFGYHTDGVLGQQFEDAGERLAVITCPLCRHEVATEYDQYMQMLRVNEIECGMCREVYSLRPRHARIQERDKPGPAANDSAGPAVRDSDGRKDWGTA